MQARDVMTTNVVIVQASTPIADIARILRTVAISGVPVFEGDTLVGIVKEVDLIARHARPHYPRYLPLLDAQIPLGGQREYQEMVRRILGTTARDIMSTPVKTCQPDTGDGTRAPGRHHQPYRSDARFRRAGDAQRRIRRLMIGAAAA